MTAMRTIVAALVFGLLAGCAARPHKIEAEYVSEMNYDARNCADLASEQRLLVEALSRASRSQRAARNWDIVAVVAIGLPVSSLSGMNRAREIARLKGELRAVEAVGDAHDCALPRYPDPTRKPKRGREFDREGEAPQPAAAG